jgi:sugar lactone lactonase YvrE
MKISDTPYYKRKQLPYKLKNINICHSNSGKKRYIVWNNLLTGIFVAFTKELRIILFLLFSLISFQNNFAQVSTGMPANDLIGQYTTTSGFLNNWTQGTANNNNGSTYGLGFNGARDVIVDTTTHRMYVSDYLNNRILIYNLDNNNILVDKSPDFVLGQTNFTSNSKGLSATKMDAPGRMALDVANQRLFVSDVGAPTISNNRILVFDVTTITNGEAAVNVLGQTSFTKDDVGTSASLMNGPGELEYIPASNRLIVNDQINNRVLVFDVTDITNGENAVNVLGQTNYTGNSAGTSSTKMDVCNGLDYDPVNQLLFVGDVNNNRVLVFDIAVITNGEAAIYVLGQTNFSNKVAAATQSGLDTPNAVEYSESLQWLFVNDVMNNRVVIYDVSTITNGENAIHVLGQADFTSKVAATTRSGFSENRSVSWEPSTSMLFVGDVANNRMMVYDIDYVITGNITHVSCYGAPEGAIDISVSGGVAPYTYLWSDGSTTPDRTNLKAGIYTVTVTYGGSITKTRTFLITQPAPPVVDGQIADDLVGQYTTTTGFTNNYSQSTINNNNGSTFDLGFNTPYDVVIDDVNHRMFVSDRVNHRVLVYNLDNDNILVEKTPDFVLGQANFTANAAANTQAGMNQPTALAYDPTTNLLFVAQAGNHRVTVYDVAGITNGENAFRVLGQSNFTNSSAANSATGMSNPSGLAYDAVNQRLFVANSGNHRVTVYDVSTITNGEAAINVLGQTSFTGSSAATSATGMRTPAGLAYDAANQRLYVADGANHRVTVYDVAAITNGEAAVNVLGQTLFTTATAAITQNGLNIPRGLTLDVTSQTLFVSDQSNHRILVYDVTSISNGENAVKVLGQPNFTTGTAGTNQSKLNVPEGLCYDMSNAKLYVSDRSNNRLLVFNFDVEVTGTVTNTTCGLDGAIDITT